MRIALFITCFNDTLFPNVGIATTQLLERLGHTVDFPEAQTCCGQMQNPYTSLWTGVTPGDGPHAFHLVLLDKGRTRVLADDVGRQALHCIRCSACLNSCPVYSRTGGHAYGARSTPAPSRSSPGHRPPVISNSAASKAFTDRAHFTCSSCAISWASCPLLRAERSPLMLLGF
jgi:L-lactate dehydrogenase complex protein LldF